MRKQTKGLVVVSHPDDETLFFGGLIQQWKHVRWTVVCVTNGNWLKRGKERMREFETACKRLGASEFIGFGLIDDPRRRLDTELLIARLQEHSGFDVVFTHGIFGEYSHPHHQDVSFAAHSVFSGKASVYSIAYNQFPDLVIHLTRKQFDLKSKILRVVYLRETLRNLHLIPATAIESFTKLSFQKVNRIYRHLIGREALARSHPDYWLAEFTRRSTRLNRKAVRVSPNGL